MGFEVGAALTSLVADAGDIVVRGQELAALHATEQEVRVARARAAVRRSGWPSSAHWPTVAASSWPMSLLRKLAVEQEACIVTVTHDEKIFDRFDRLIHLRDGRLTDA